MKQVAKRENETVLLAWSFKVMYWYCAYIYNNGAGC